MAESSFGRIALLSIHPRHADAILRGDKQVELRRVAISSDTTHALVYATAPVAGVVGWFEIAGIDQATKTEIWDRHGLASGITRREYRSYFAGARHAVAIEIAAAHRLVRTVDLTELPRVLRAPQSFQYLDPSEVAWVFARNGRRSSGPEAATDPRQRSPVAPSPVG